ncbi:hypothetical protein P3G55_22320 [Leptospira sp. 96542]|nr:hypothetical protein [Leptospira sp. 96542]
MNKLKTISLFFILTLPFALMITFPYYSKILFNTFRKDLFLYIAATFVLTFLWWLHSLAIFFESIKSKEILIKLNKAKFFIYFSALAILLLIIPEVIPKILEIFPRIQLLSFLLLIPSSFTNFYIIIKLATSLNSIEKGKYVTTSESVKEILSFWFYPLGIWNIQPRILKLSSINLKDNNN